jgi:hypothetical protein
MKSSLEFKTPTKIRSPDTTPKSFYSTRIINFTDSVQRKQNMLSKQLSSAYSRICAIKMPPCQTNPNNSRSFRSKLTSSTCSRNELLHSMAHGARNYYRINDSHSAIKNCISVIKKSEKCERTNIRSVCPIKLQDTSLVTKMPNKASYINSEINNRLSKRIQQINNHIQSEKKSMDDE